MAQTTANLQKMKTVSSELEKIYAALTNNKKTLDETMSQLPKIWQGEAATTYFKAYQENSQYFAQIAQAIQGASSTMGNIATAYNKADLAAADAIKSKMAKG